MGDVLIIDQAVGKQVFCSSQNLINGRDFGFFFAENDFLFFSKILVNNMLVP